MRLRRREIAAPISTELRAELDQTPQWWDRLFNELVRQAYTVRPFDPAEHEGHKIVEAYTFGGALVLRECTECPRQLVPRES